MCLPIIGQILVSCWLKIVKLAGQLWCRHPWVRGYFATRSGNVTDDVIVQYIAMQDLQEHVCDDDCTIGS